MPAKFWRSTLILALVILIQACVVRVNANDGHDHITRVFGGIEIDAGKSAGRLDTVNGSIRLHDDSQADSVETVNGSIRLYDNVSVYSLATTNGSIRAGRDLKVDDDVKTVNGRIELRPGTVVKHDVETVNGGIELVTARVLGDVETTNGDIRLLDGTSVSGDVVFRESRSYFFHDSDRPTLVVDADSSVGGTIHLYREVRLRIADGAEIGARARGYEAEKQAGQDPAESHWSSAPKSTSGTAR